MQPIHAPNPVDRLLESMQAFEFHNPNHRSFPPVAEGHEDNNTFPTNTLQPPKGCPQNVEGSYAGFDKASRPFPVAASLNEISMGATLELVRGHIHANIHPGLSDYQNIFEAGGDSLLAARIHRGIVQSLHASAPAVSDIVVRSLPHRLAFAFPTIITLAAFVYGLLVRDTQKSPDSPFKSIPVSILNQKDQTIVRLREPVSAEPPLILVHGGSGHVFAFGYMQADFKTGLWAIQVTKDTPRTSFVAQTDFYYTKIKEAQPRGPYRIGGYCAGALIACRIARLLEKNGDEVVQLVLIDNSPFMSLFPHSDVDISANFGDPHVLRQYHDRRVRSLCKAMLSWADPWWHKFSEVVWERWNGRVRSDDMPELMATAYQNLVEGSARAFDFMLGLTASGRKGYPEVTAALIKWMKEVRAPVTLYKASDGPMSNISAHLEKEWWAFGLDWCCENVQVVELDATHTGILDCEQLVEAMQKWERHSY
ncbi:Alpha/Beta hydrolase protein [Mycena metata]|uniref:Alpha/Beta hydrolase protein n=1 Tax=Mycena metata TaxID=1033252 RepID=A0AAD7JRT0_9AGAR|nr:Alpha/Beta hydrolase protein [Mycena metata]